MTSISSPPTPKPLLLFAAHALVLALLLGYWPSARDAFPGLFRAGVDVAFPAVDGDPLVVRAGALRGDDVTDSFLERVDPDAKEPVWRVGFSGIRLFWWPFAVLAALLFATPSTARRRAIALGAGGVAMGAFALGRLWLEVARANVELAHGGAGAEEEGPVLLLRSATEVLNSNIVVIALVLLVWVILASPQRVLRMGALAGLLGVGRPARPR